MSSEVRNRNTGYRYNRFRILWSATIIVLSVIFALLLFQQQPVLLLLYLVLTVLLTTGVLTLKIRFLRVRSSEASEEELSDEMSKQNWRSLLMLLGLLVASMSVPLLLARYNPEFWFTSILSYTSSVSAGEVLFFVLAKKG